MTSDGRGPSLLTHHALRVKAVALFNNQEEVKVSVPSGARVLVMRPELRDEPGTGLDCIVASGAQKGRMRANTSSPVTADFGATRGLKVIGSSEQVQVVDALKGQPGTTAYFKLPGGQVGRYRRVMVGAPQFAPGDEVVLFLKGSAPAVPMPFGLTQGVYRVNRDVSGRAVVMPAIAGGSGRVVKGDPARQPLELGAFARMVRTIAGAQR